MKVKILKDYNDLQLKRLVVADDELTVSEARGKVLIKAGVAEEIIVEKAPENDEKKPAPKKKTTKKV